MKLVFEGSGVAIATPFKDGKVDFEYYDNPAIEGSVDATKQAEAIKKAEEALNKDKQAFTGAYLDPQPSWS